MKKCFAFCLLLMACVPVLSQSITTSATQNKSVDYQRLKRIDTLLNQYIDRGWLNGVVTIVIKDDQIVQYKGYGWQDAASKKPMPKDALFRIASQTKAIVSVAVMTLFEEGKFTLDEAIADFIPAFANTPVLDSFNQKDSTYSTVPAKRGITFRDLLTHTSGLDYPGIGSPSMKAIYQKANIPSGLGDIDADLLERVNALARLPLAHQPGEKWTYGLSMDVLGCLVEVISGQSLSDYCASHIFKPLGMNDTYFNVPAVKAARLATVYTENKDHKPVPWTKAATGIDPNYPLANKHYFSGGAGLTSTAYDYAIFLEMLLHDGIYNGVRILAPRTVELMTSNQLPVSFDGTNDFGLSFQLTTAKSAAQTVRSEGSFSWGGFFGTTYWADPKKKMVVLIMTQQVPNSHGDFEPKFEQLVYSSLQ